MNLGNLSRLSTAQSRSISAENFTGEKGKGGIAVEGTGSGPGRELGQGWKISPSINIAPQSVITLAEIDAYPHKTLSSENRSRMTLNLLVE